MVEEINNLFVYILIISWRVFAADNVFETDASRVPHSAVLTAPPCRHKSPRLYNTKWPLQGFVPGRLSVTAAPLIQSNDCPTPRKVRWTPQLLLLCYSVRQFFYGRPLSVAWAKSMLYFANVYLFIYFLWPPYAPALVNGGSRKFYTWWTFSVNREVCHV